MTVQLHIEAETHAELLNKVINALHLPCDIGLRVEIREKDSVAAGAPTTVAQEDGPEAVRSTSPEAQAEGIPEAVGHDNSASPAADPPQRRKRRTKAEMEAARAAEAAQDVPPLPLDAPVNAPAAATGGTFIFDDEPALTPPPPNPKITEDQLREKLQTLAARDGGAGLKAVLPVLEKYGYTKVKGIKPEHYEPIAGDIDAILKKAA